MPTTAQKIKSETARFYAFRVLPGGGVQRMTPFGRSTFGSTGLVWLKARAKRRKWKLIVHRLAPNKRSVGLASMRWALAAESRIHYRQLRPFDGSRFRRRSLPISADCSATFTMIAKAAGFDDPNGYAYDCGRHHPAFTGTIRANLARRASVAHAAPCDPIVYGSGSGKHVVAVFELDPAQPHNPWVWSHGQENGPRVYRHLDQLAYHGGGCTVHDVERRAA